MDIEILYEDENMVVVNKPHGLLVIPDRFDSNIPSLNKILEAKLNRQIWVVHRLDKETTGIICFAKNEETHRYMSLLFQEREVEKYYIGIVTGNLTPSEGRIEAAITEHPFIKGKMTVTQKGKPSITDYTVVQQWALYALVRFRIFTGRTHQIRVHMQSIGHPLICDSLYGNGKPFYLSKVKKNFKLSQKEETERPLVSRIALHAEKLTFIKQDGEQITIEAPLPKDMAACVKQLNKWTTVIE